MDPAVFNSDLSKVSIQLHYYSLIALVAYKKIASISKNKIRNIFFLYKRYDFLISSAFSGTRKKSAGPPIRNVVCLLISSASSIRLSSRISWNRCFKFTFTDLHPLSFYTQLFYQMISAPILFFPLPHRFIILFNFTNVQKKRIFSKILSILNVVMTVAKQQTFLSDRFVS